MDQEANHSSSEKMPISSTESTPAKGKNNKIDKSSNPTARSLSIIVNHIKSEKTKRAIRYIVVTVFLGIIASAAWDYIKVEIDNPDQQNEKNHVDLLIKNAREQLANGNFTSAVFYWS